MTKLFGSTIKSSELRKRVGDMGQIAGYKRYELREGNRKGVEAVDIWNASGLNFTVLVDRGLDIFSASHCGRSLCWHSSTGPIAPSFYEPEGLGWLRGFQGGLVTTCGLTYAGAPCEDEGEPLGLHGRASYTPATQVETGAQWVGDRYGVWVAGKIRETRVFGANLVVSRTISTVMSEPRIFLHDIVDNEGFDRTPFMLVYHINLGYPVVDSGSVLSVPVASVEPRDEEAADGFKTCRRFHKPRKGYAEKCYYYELKADPDGMVYAGVVNRKFDGGRGLGVYLKYRKDDLPHFVEWKMMGEGTYVVGLEPGNCLVSGRATERKEGRLKFLEPGQRAEIHLEIGVLTSRREIADFEKKVQSCAGKK
jgi:hypothetical protein